MLHKIIKFFANEYDHYLLNKIEQIKYELEEEIKTLEKTYANSHSQIIWDKLEMKRKELLNVSQRLAHRKMKKDGTEP